jgi:hypothetical protein
MVKTILKISCLLIFFSCSKSKYNQEAEAEKASNDANYEKNYKTLNVKGNVKSIVCTIYKQFIPDSLLGDLITKQDFIFNKKGNVIEEKTYFEDEELRYKDVYEYDKMNNITKYYSYDGDGKKLYTMSYFYNKQGKLLRSVEEPIEGRIIENKYRYEELGGGANGYNIKYDAENKAVDQYFYKYNTLGKVTEYGSYQNDDTTKFVAYKTFTYDNNGKLLAMKESTGREYIYDQNESIVSQIYDEKRTFTSTYVYDKKNNWIKRTSYLPNGKLRSVLERKIEYFD